MSTRAIDSGVRIGHVHLKVADIARSLVFYRDVLGFEVTQRYGPDAVFLSAGGYHHHIGLNTWESKGGTPPPPGTTGLFHVAILYPTRAALADAFRRIRTAGIELDGASDHMALAKRSICETRMGTESNSTGIDQRRRGHEQATEAWQCSSSPLILKRSPKSECTDSIAMASHVRAITRAASALARESSRLLMSRRGVSRQSR
jgi:catechol 2,3-dioxygenase-like lactoylglutathione lyase family enzyme